ncbi:hypothetical protein N3K66_001456 [Trichothecium roseum]|uniref:Uncharacterized protein n=1 Tax=Trichothecium roseum TaxID=47278 RepID=A0ACC0VGA8_9HYPO|nr:hypothetical protein N3K66_001456 [Trichothecium roseum]
MADEAPPAEPVLLFRPTKKRKAYRARPSAQDDENDNGDQQKQREQTGLGSRATTTARNRRNGEAPGDNNDDDDNDDDDNNNDNDSSSSSDSDDGNYDGVAAALRARSMRRKLHGVNFQSSSSSNSHGGRGADPWSLGNAPPDNAEDAGATQVVGMSNRFMHQTGLVKDHSAKHLNEFIASRLSSRTVAPNPPGDDPLPPGSTNTTTTTTAGTLRTAPAPQGVKQGRLEEVALPAAPARPPPQTQIAAPPKKVRLGPDGKPWRGRKRRASDDVKRDQLVEEFLHENRLDVYDVPKTDNNSASEADGAADERLAKEFRQQYLDDVARRQQSKKKKKQSKKQQPQNARPATEVLRGPKLGGSRNSRAQVRNQLLKEKKEAAAAKK